MDSIFIDYEDVLIGRCTTIAAYNFFKASERGANHRKALACIHYAIESLLQWDIKEAELKFDEYIIKLMHLEQLVNNIIFPVEVPLGDPRYILHLLYPRQIKYDYAKSVENVFLNVLENNGTFPREYFLGEGGFFRYTTCLSYLLNNYMTFDTLDEVYEFILSNKGRRFLSRNRLWVPADQMGIDLLECIYAATENDPHSLFYYTYYTFCEQRKRLADGNENLIEME